MFKEKMKSFFAINNSNKMVIVSLVITFIISFASYNAFIVNGFASPDGILEGQHYYINQHWAIAGCGRWFLALLNSLHANLVLPWLTIIECTCVNWLSAHTLCKILKIEKQSFYYVICSLFAVLPTFIEMYAYTNSALSFCISVLFSILFVFFNLYNNKYLIILSATLLGCAMGSYQSQVGIVVGLTLMCLINKVLDKENNIIKFFFISLISGLLGLIVYIIGLEFFLKLYNLSLFSRASTFSLSAIFTNFIPRFAYVYHEFFNAFNQIALKRWLIYIVFFVIVALEIIILMIKQVKNKEYKNALLFVILILLIPPTLNIIGIILPNEPITSMMLTPCYLIVPFALGLSKYVFNITDNLIKCILTLCISCLTWTYILSANATYDCYRLSYNMIKTQFSNAIDKVLELDDYQINSTRIVVIGCPSESKIRENNQIYNYGIHLYNNLLYWESPELDQRATSIYILEEFGIDPGVMEYDEYKNFIKLQECKEMQSWPKEGSVRMINDCAVIKFSEVYE